MNLKYQLLRFLLAFRKQLGISPQVPAGTNILMNIRNFIGLSSALLMVWLGTTYLHKVPTERYRQQGRSPSPATGKIVDPAAEMTAGIAPGKR